MATTTTIPQAPAGGQPGQVPIATMPYTMTLPDSNTSITGTVIDNGAAYVFPCSFHQLVRATKTDVMPHQPASRHHYHFPTSAISRNGPCRRSSSVSAPSASGIMTRIHSGSKYWHRHSVTDTIERGNHTALTDLSLILLLLNSRGKLPYRYAPYRDGRIGL